MKSNFPRIKLAKLCSWFGITRQAYYQNGWKGVEISIKEDVLLKEVLEIRKDALPGLAEHPVEGRHRGQVDALVQQDRPRLGRGDVSEPPGMQHVQDGLALGRVQRAGLAPVTVRHRRRPRPDWAGAV